MEGKKSLFPGEQRVFVNALGIASSARGDEKALQDAATRIVFVVAVYVYGAYALKTANRSIGRFIIRASLGLVSIRAVTFPTATRPVVRSIGSLCPTGTSQATVEMFQLFTETQRAEVPGRDHTRLRA